jgi:hypothetical protein
MNSRPRTIAILLVTFIFMGGFLAYGQEYSRSGLINPIRIDRTDLLNAVTEIFAYVQKVNGEQIELKGAITLKNDKNSTTLSLPIDQKDFDKFPRISYEAYLNISAYAYKGQISQISYVRLSLSDGYRSFEVNGSSQDHATGLVAIIQEKLQSAEYPSGGKNFRLFVALMGMFLYMFVTIFNWFGLEDRDRLIMLAGCTVLWFTVFFLPPWDIIFPGFISIVADRPFLERNSALFTFIGIILTVLIPIATYLIRHRTKHDKLT